MAHAEKAKKGPKKGQKRAKKGAQTSDGRAPYLPEKKEKGLVFALLFFLASSFGFSLSSRSFFSRFI
jgi:hypothetical protein